MVKINRFKRQLENMQIAYKMMLGAEGRSTAILNYIFKYLEGLRTHAKISFVDFSSAFNILCPLILNYLKHLKHLSLIIILWVGPYRSLSKCECFSPSPLFCLSSGLHFDSTSFLWSLTIIMIMFDTYACLVGVRC